MFSFSKVKIGFDVTMVAVSLTAYMIVLKKFDSVGAVIGVLNNLYGEKRDLLLAGENGNY